jgi:multiple sugar transport system substrate-binding protein
MTAAAEPAAVGGAVAGGFRENMGSDTAPQEGPPQASHLSFRAKGTTMRTKPHRNSRRVALATASLLGLAGLAMPAAAETITVMLPSFGSDAAAREVFKGFTKETGVEVDLQTMPWDDIRPKIVTAVMAGSAPADVTEFDWSWVGQFGAAGWYVPLDEVLDPAVLADIPTAKVFTYEGKVYGIPYSNDFRVQSINTEYLKRAGIGQPPATPDEILRDARIIKEKKVVEYPISFPLAAAEGTSTAWYFLTRMHGGELFDADWKPLFTEKGSPGYKALEWILQGLKDGLIDPASTGLTDLQTTAAFAAGDAAIDLAGHPYDIGQYNDPQRSKVVGQVVFSLAGADPAKLRTIGLPEALGVLKNSGHQEAAFKFIRWWADHQSEMYGQANFLATRSSVLVDLNNAKKLAGGEGIARYSPFTEAIFPQGTPAWYSEFSSAVAATINQAAKGQITVDGAVAQIADRADAAMQQ